MAEYGDSIYGEKNSIHMEKIIKVADDKEIESIKSLIVFCFPGDRDG